MKERLLERLREVLRALLDAAGDSGPLPEFSLEVPKRADHGDFACNAAMLLAKRLKQPPRAIAERLAAELGDAGELVARTEIAGPGFLNLWLAETRWQDLLRLVLERGPQFGASTLGSGRRVVGWKIPPN